MARRLQTICAMPVVTAITIQKNTMFSAKRPNKVT
jgi:hypothetical protein